jgi:5'-methylthioadenosine phosphorylase
MTGMPEARLAREAEICYASLAMVTDYDCWHPDHGAVDVAQVLATLAANANNAARVVENLPHHLSSRAECPCGCDRALTGTIMTATDKRDATLIAKLATIAGRLI